jgi:hypothetical protein
MDLIQVIINNMNHITNLYKHKCEQLQEQIYHLTKMLNEADAPGPTQFSPEWHPPLLAPADFQVHQEPPPSGPNYNFPPPPFSNHPNPQMSDFFPPGLSRTVEPNPRHYPGGERDLQYRLHMEQYRIACANYDRVNGTGRKPTNFGPIRKVLDVVNDISSPNFGRSR